MLKEVPISELLGGFHISRVLILEGSFELLAFVVK